MEKTISDNQLRALRKIRGDWGDVTEKSIHANKNIRKVGTNNE